MAKHSTEYIRNAYRQYRSGRGGLTNQQMVALRDRLQDLMNAMVGLEDMSIVARGVAMDLSAIEGYVLERERETRGGHLRRVK